MRGLFGLLGLVAWAACILVVHADAEGSEYAIIGSAALGGALIGVATVRAGCAWMVAGLASAGLLTAFALSQGQTLSEEGALTAVGLMAVGGLLAGWIGGALAD